MHSFFPIEISIIETGETKWIEHPTALPVGVPLKVLKVTKTSLGEIYEACIKLKDRQKQLSENSDEYREMGTELTALYEKAGITFGP